MRRHSPPQHGRRGLLNPRLGCSLLHRLSNPDSPPVTSRAALSIAAVLWTMNGGGVPGLEYEPPGRHGSSVLIHQGDFADAFVLPAEDALWAFGTNAGDTNVQVLRSTDNGQTWTPMPDALPELPDWARPGRTWAPAAFFNGAEYVLYYTVTDDATALQTISFATSATPGGPYVDRSAGPFLAAPKQGGVIDPDIVVSEDGAPWLAWKTENDRKGRPSVLWEQQLSRDGKEFVGRPRIMFRGDALWEHNTAEAITRKQIRPGLWVAFYSGSQFHRETYGVGYGVGKGPGHPWRKVTTGSPWLAPGVNEAGPGSTAVYRNFTGQQHLMWSSWEKNRVGYKRGGRRALWASQVEFLIDRKGRLLDISLEPRRPAQGGPQALAPAPTDLPPKPLTSLVGVVPVSRAVPAAQRRQPRSP